MTDFIDELIEILNKRDPHGAAVQNAMTFTLTQDHLDLIKRMYIGWDSDAYEGAPAVGIKRPYGNSDVINDVAEILAMGPDYRGIVPEEKYVYGREGDIKAVTHRDGRTFTLTDLEKLHRETELALQIVLCTQSFVPGVYRKREQYNSLSWALDG